MSEPVSEIPKIFKVGDFLKMKEDRLKSIGKSNSPDVLVAKTSLKAQIDSVRDFAMYLAEEQRPKDSEIEKTNILEDALKLDLEEFVPLYSQTTQDLIALYDSTFKDMGLDNMKSDLKNNAISWRYCINLREATQKEIGHLVKIYKK